MSGKSITAAFLCSLALVGAPFADAQSGDLPELEAGASIFWATSAGVSENTFRERVVAVGEDWVLYESLFEDAWTDEDTPVAERLFLLFSGIDYRGCHEDPLPTPEERAALKSLRPVTPGDKVEIGSLDSAPVITVGEPVEYYLMGKTHPAHRIMLDHQGDDMTDENLVVLDEADLTVVIDWDDESRDKVMSIMRAKREPAAAYTDIELGTCAPIMNEKQG